MLADGVAHGALYPLGVPIAILLLPLALIVPVSFSRSEMLEFPPRAWSLRWYREWRWRARPHNEG